MWIAKIRQDMKDHQEGKPFKYDKEFKVETCEETNLAQGTSYTGEWKGDCYEAQRVRQGCGKARYSNGA